MFEHVKTIGYSVEELLSDNGGKFGNENVQKVLHLIGHQMVDTLEQNGEEKKNEGHPRLPFRIMEIRATEFGHEDISDSETNNEEEDDEPTSDRQQRNCSLLHILKHFEDHIMEEEF
ncbi:hypothetical protein NPIL_44541 [Nephila pilipes]|uniref:Uncharacterized protein n=1 Tax=Nephila pilipes TaxID=299642 RepID=A0A8X6JAY9_NEPPI|nr:hypothetical protein NPIL_44541 [Nephila pilipes]